MKVEENDWIGIIEYAHQTKMSVSTIRRKIKKHQLEFKTKNGRYLIKRSKGQEGKAVKEGRVDLNSSSELLSLEGICKEMTLKYELLLEENVVLKLKLKSLEEEKRDLEMLIEAYEYNSKGQVEKQKTQQRSRETSI